MEEPPRSGPGPAPRLNSVVNPNIRRNLFPKLEIKTENDDTDPLLPTGPADTDSDVEFICEVDVVGKLQRDLQVAKEKAAKYEALLGSLQALPPSQESQAGENETAPDRSMSDEDADEISASDEKPLGSDESASDRSKSDEDADEISASDEKPLGSDESASDRSKSDEDADEISASDEKLLGTNESASDRSDDDRGELSDSDEKPLGTNESASDRSDDDRGELSDSDEKPLGTNESASDRSDDDRGELSDSDDVKSLASETDVRPNPKVQRKKPNPRAATLAGQNVASSSEIYWNNLIEHRHDGIAHSSAFDKSRRYWSDGKIAAQAFFSNAQAAAILIPAAKCGPPKSFYRGSSRALAPSGHALEFVRTASYLVDETTESKLDLRGRPIFDGLGYGENVRSDGFGIHLVNNDGKKVTDAADATGLRVTRAPTSTKENFPYYIRCRTKAVEYGDSRIVRMMWEVEGTQVGYPPAHRHFLISFKRNDGPAKIPAVYRIVQGESTQKHPLRPSEKKKMEPRFLNSTAGKVCFEEAQKLVDGKPIRTPSEWDCAKMRRAAIKEGKAVSRGRRHRKPDSSNIQATLMDMVNANDHVFNGYELIPPDGNVKGAGQAVHTISKVGLAEMMKVATTEGAAKLDINPAICSVDTTFFNHGGGNCYVTTIAMRSPRIWNTHQGPSASSHMLFPVVSTAHETRQNGDWAAFATAFKRALRKAGGEELNIHALVMDGDLGPYKALVEIVPAFKNTIALECGRHLRGNLEDYCKATGIPSPVSQDICFLVMGYETGGSERVRTSGFCDFSSSEMGTDDKTVSGRAWKWLVGKVTRRLEAACVSEYKTTKVLTYLRNTLCPRIRKYYSRDVRMRATSQVENPGRYTSNDIEQCQGSMKAEIGEGVVRHGIVGTSAALGDWMLMCGRKLVLALYGLSPSEAVLDKAYAHLVPTQEQFIAMTKEDKAKLVKKFFGPYAAKFPDTVEDEDPTSPIPLPKSEIWVQELISKRSFDIVWAEAEGLLRTKQMTPMPRVDGDLTETWILLDLDGRPLAVKKDEKGLILCSVPACRPLKASRICAHTLAVASYTEDTCRSWVYSLKEFATEATSRKRTSKALTRDYNINAGKKGKKKLDLQRPKKALLLGTRERRSSSSEGEDEEEPSTNRGRRRRRKSSSSSASATRTTRPSAPTSPPPVGPSPSPKRRRTEESPPLRRRAHISDSSSGSDAEKTPAKTSSPVPETPGHPWTPRHRQQTPGKDWGKDWDNTKCCEGRAYIPTQEEMAQLTLLDAPMPNPLYAHEASSANYFVVKYNDRRHFERWDTARCRSCKASIHEQTSKGAPFDLFVVHREAMLIPKAGRSFSDYDRAGIDFHAPNRLDRSRGLYWQEQYHRQVDSGNFSISPHNFAEIDSKRLPRRLFCPFFSCIKLGNATFVTEKLFLTDRAKDSWSSAYNTHFAEQFGLRLEGWNDKASRWDMN